MRCYQSLDFNCIVAFDSDVCLIELVSGVIRVDRNLGTLQSTDDVYMSRATAAGNFREPVPRIIVAKLASYKEMASPNVPRELPHSLPEAVD